MEKVFSTSVNPDFNTWLTQLINSYGKPNKQEIKIFKKAYDIIVTERRGFTVKDIAVLWKGNTQKKREGSARQFISKFKECIYKVSNKKLREYGLTGLYINKLTDYHTSKCEISSDFDKLIKKCKREEPQFHNPRLVSYLEDDQLFQRLKQMDCPILNGNFITVRPPNIEPNRKITVNVYPNQLLFMLGCSDNPIPFSDRGLHEMNEFIKETILWLRLYAQGLDFNTQRFFDMTITHYDFGHDLKFDDRKFDYTIGQLQVYLHENKSTKEKLVRYEQTVTKPQKISELAETIRDYQNQIENEIQNDQIESLNQYEKEKYAIFQKASKL